MRRQKHAPTRCIGIDVDGTLIQGGRFNSGLAEWAREKKGEGFDVLLWSARGRKYAEAVAEKYGVTDCFTAIIGKPGYVVDDLGWSWVKYSVVVKKLF